MDLLQDRKLAAFLRLRNFVNDSRSDGIFLPVQASGSGSGLDEGISLPLTHRVIAAGYLSHMAWLG